MPKHTSSLLRKFTHASLGIATCGAVALTAFAAVTFDPATGGFVGKGDVQTLFGWNNATMQANYAGVSFEYESSATYTFDCEWWTGPEHNRTRHENTKTLTVGVAATAVTAQAKSNSSANLTGWFLSPIAMSGTTSSGPTNSDCGAEGNEMKSIVPGSIELLSSSTGGLYVVHDGVRHLLQ